MKERWNREEAQAAAEEIRNSSLPKSITPDMVGGALLTLTNAVGEVVEVLGEIPREHVKVKVRGYDGEEEVSADGATVRLDVFAVGGYPTVQLPRQELTCDKNGVVEFDVPHGYMFAVSSHIEGLGASFQHVFTASTEKRDVRLWNFPIGVWALGHTDLSNYDVNGDGSGFERYTAIPWITSEWEDDIPSEIALWAQNEDEFPDCEGWWYVGILVSTAETTFAIGKNNLSDETMTWCDSRDYNTLFPLMEYSLTRRNEPYDWGECQERARMDYDGNMNTAKLLGHRPTHTAARCAANKIGDHDEERFLPSAGQLYIMWLNRDAINALIEQSGDEGFKLLPYQNAKGQWQYPCGDSWWWSSSVFDPLCSWVVHYNGGVNDVNRNYDIHVRAVSAFHFEY